MSYGSSDNDNVDANAYHMAVLHDVIERSKLHVLPSDFPQSLRASLYSTFMWDEPEVRFGYTIVDFSLSDELARAIDVLMAETRFGFSKRMIVEAGKPRVCFSFDLGIHADIDEPNRRGNYVIYARFEPQEPFVLYPATYGFARSL